MKKESNMKIEKEKIEELKARYAKGIYQSGIAVYDEEGAVHEVEFIYRKPTVTDMEAMGRTAQKSPATANSNLLMSIIVYPEAKAVIAQLAEYPLAVNQFVDSEIGPFLGAKHEEFSSKKL